MDCPGALQSYGRRRRSTNDTEDATDDSGYYRSSTEHSSPPHKKPLGRDTVSTRITSSDGSGASYEDRFLLPETVALGLRLTVGEDVNQKPFLPSMHGAGHFGDIVHVDGLAIVLHIAHGSFEQ